MTIKEDKELYPDGVRIYTVYQSIINERLTKPEGRDDFYFPGMKRNDYRPSPSRKVFQTEDRKEYLAKKKEWLAEYQNDRAEKKANRAAMLLPKFSNPRVKEIVNILFEKQRNNVMKSLKSIYADILEEIKKLEGKSSWDKDVRSRLDMRDIRFNRVYDWTMEVPGKSSYSPNELKYLKKNHAEIIKRFIKDDFDAIMGSFLAKMEFKLTDTIKNKEIKEFKSQGLEDGWVSFSFVDGSRFEMENTIEWGRSKFGLSFQRFPCRFKGVIMSDGSQMKGPSEAKMQKEF